MGKQKAEVVLPPGRLWPNTPWGTPMEIEIFGGTGEFSAGKTILGLSIAPGAHPEGHAFAGQPRTLYFDLEKSGATYAGTGCRRIDVPAELAKVYGPNYTAKQAAEWYCSQPKLIKPGQYDVIMTDPINDIESGVVNIVRSNPSAHGYTKGQFDNSVGLLMAAMKAHWKRIIMSFGCKCFFFTTHLRDEFKGGRPSGKREPRGKETLAELASLYLWLERPVDAQGNQADKPAAIVMKQRLADTRINEAGELEVVNLMPPRIPVATVQEIRRYIANPPDYSKLSAAEKVIEKPVTEVEMQRMKLATAEAEATAATAKVNAMEHQKELISIRLAAQATTPQTADQSAQVHQAAAEKREANAEAEEAARKLAEADAEGRRLMEQNQKPIKAAASGRVERFMALRSATGVSPEKLVAAFSMRGAQRFTTMSESAQDEILAWLDAVADCLRLVEVLGLDESKVNALCSRVNVERIADMDGGTAGQLKATLQRALDARTKN